MFYYRIQNSVVCTRTPLRHVAEINELEAMQAEKLVYLSNRSGAGKTVYRINHRGYLADAAEDLWCLDTNQLNNLADRMEAVPEWLAQKADEGRLMGICADETMFSKQLSHHLNNE